MRAALAAVLLGAVLCGCHRPKPEPVRPGGLKVGGLPVPPAKKTKAPQRLPLTRLVFPDGDSLEVELASTHEQRLKGLMFRESLREDEGMIFVFPGEQTLGFWMMNTYVDLDILFIGSDKRITVVHHDVPATPKGSKEVAKRSGRGRYVLELPAGQARRRGLEPGQRLRFLEGR